MKQLGKLRKIAGMTQDQLAEKLGVKRSALAMWETRANTPPTKYLLPLSRLLSVPVETLLQLIETEE